jgi:hypothetical protein
MEYNLAEPWRRQPFDTDASYAIFQDFLALKPPRNLTALPRGVVDPSRAWRINMGWDARAAAWDAHLATLRLEAAERVTTAMAERHARLGYRVSRFAEGQLERLRRAAEALPEDLPRLNDGQILRYLETGIRIEREAAGVADAPKEELDTTKLDVDELRTLRELLAKAAK